MSLWFSTLLALSLNSWLNVLRKGTCSTSNQSFCLILRGVLGLVGCVACRIMKLDKQCTISTCHFSSPGSQSSLEMNPGDTHDHKSLILLWLVSLPAVVDLLWDEFGLTVLTLFFFCSSGEILVKLRLSFQVAFGLLRAKSPFLFSFWFNTGGKHLLSLVDVPTIHSE